MNQLTPCLLLLTLTAPLAAQDPEGQIEDFALRRVQRLLGSDEATEVAWGAFLAGKYRLYEVGNSLVRELRRWDGDSDEHLIVQLHLLDGLLRIQREPPYAQLSRLLKHPITREAAFALLALDPVNNAPALLDIVKSPAAHNDLVRQTAGQLLLYALEGIELDRRKKAHLRDLIQYAIEDLYAVFSVTVWGDNSGSWNSAVGLPDVDRGFNFNTNSGFPPRVRFWLTSEDRIRRLDYLDQDPRLVVGAVGPLDTVFLLRSEPAIYLPRHFKKPAQQPHPSPETAMRWLKATARDRSPRSHRPHQFSHSLTWTDAEAFEAVCREEYNRHRASLDELVKQVRQRVFLPVLVDYQIPLKLEVNDYRSDKTEALPELQLGK